MLILHWAVFSPVCQPSRLISLIGVVTIKLIQFDSALKVRVNLCVISGDSGLPVGQKLTSVILLILIALLFCVVSGGVCGKAPAILMSAASAVSL